PPPRAVVHSRDLVTPPCRLGLFPPARQWPAESSGLVTHRPYLGAALSSIPDALGATPLPGPRWRRHGSNHDWPLGSAMPADSRPCAPCGTAPSSSTAVERGCARQVERCPRNAGTCTIPSDASPSFAAPANPRHPADIP